ncbi:alpha-amylase [Marinigracilibium pacificum]|uniref:Alpha-amylase n=1 Tax=Marinigracilibium pacificum TaxID=2729599 RepID=A0A848J5Z9_9BACT|nr:alpha-amylase [Marinigracilibium pacificum]NMM50885.1 alpha-amylase [Marinigracilibium pacificum]
MFTQIKHGALLCVAGLLCACSNLEEQPVAPSHQEVIEVTPPISENERSAGPGGGVIMQAFYWDVPAGGNWYNTIKSKISDWDAAGISAIWLPPVSKAMNGPYSMGYDPFDYFDLGEYNQMGSVETRFGSKNELISLINTAHNKNIQVYADIVINHNSGGALENNPFTGTKTYTDYNPASGKFFRSAGDFHPNNYANNDQGVFAGFPDLSHSVPYVQGWLWKNSNSVAKYYKNVIGFDGWRFDYVKGFGGWVVRDWVNEVGGFAVGENWDGNANNLKNWVNSTNRKASAFDFACYYKLDEAFDGNDLTKLNADMLWKRDPSKAVTFVSNHDTDIIWDKMHAYAYILTHEGYPTIFYRDYEEWLNKDKLKNLIWIHRNLAVGNTSILHVDNDEYIARRNGNPGIVVYLNDSGSWVERWVQTNWNSIRIKDYTGNSSWEPVTQGNGWVKIQCPPNSYTIWSRM